MRRGVFCNVAVDLQGLKVIEVRAAQLPEAAGCRAVTLPGLSLQQEVGADGGEARQQLQQARVSVVQVDPHGDGQAQTQVEVGAAVLAEEVLQLVGFLSDVQLDEGDVAVERVGLLCALNKSFIQVKPQKLNCALLWFLDKMFVDGHTQVLVFTQEELSYCSDNIKGFLFCLKFSLHQGCRNYLPHRPKS